MGHKKLKVDYLMQYGDEIALLRDGLSLRRVQSRTGRAINTLRKLRTLFVIWKIDRALTLPTFLSPSFGRMNNSPPRHLHTDDNSSQPLHTRRALSTLGKLSSHLEMMVTRKASVFSKNHETFRRHFYSETRRGTSRSKNVKIPERMGNYGNS